MPANQGGRTLASGDPRHGSRVISIGIDASAPCAPAMHHEAILAELTRRGVRFADQVPCPADPSTRWCPRSAGRLGRSDAWVLPGAQLGGPFRGLAAKRFQGVALLPFG